MNCATHNEIAAVAFCRTCGKALCSNCTRDVRGVIYCESCLAARLEGTAPAAGFLPAQTPYQQVVDQGSGVKVSPGPSSGPNPTVAGILGAIPFGIGAVYNGQYAKGLAHLVIFALLCVAAGQTRDPVDTFFGLGIAFFWIYQIFDAVRTAKAIQAGQPAPDPLGLGQTFGGGQRFEASKVPFGAVVLIGLGVLFLLHTMGFWEFGFERFWPLLIVALGVWMFYRQWKHTDQRCTCGRCRTRWLMGPSLVLTTGVVLLLQTSTPIGIDRTWPAWILVVGIVKLLQSTASSQGHVGPLPPGPPPAAPPQAPPPTSTEPSSGEVHNV